MQCMLIEFSRAIQLACINCSLLLLCPLLYAFQWGKKQTNRKANKRLLPLPNFPFLPKPFLFNCLSHLETEESVTNLPNNPLYSFIPHIPNGLKWQLHDSFTHDEKILFSQILNKIASYKVCCTFRSLLQRDALIRLY